MSGLKNKESDLSWGDPLIVRQALVETLGRNFSLFSVSLRNMGYPDHLGSPKLVEQLKEMAKRQTGHKPKYLYVTCGATGAINAGLHALTTNKTLWVTTSKRYYPLYPIIVNTTNMVMVNSDNTSELTKRSIDVNNKISLVASPSNPEGLVYPFESVDIYDAAYASKTYSRGAHTPDKYRVMCGSLSKTLGLAGLRLGWVSTNDDILAKKLHDYIIAAYVGLSSLSMATAEEVLSVLDQDAFEILSAGYLDDNRYQMQKVLTKFGQGDVPIRGMFAILELGKAERKALERANVKWQLGSTWGETDSWARLSLGATRESTKCVVKAILK